jgi:hypothetical protein
LSCRLIRWLRRSQSPPKPQGVAAVRAGRSIAWPFLRTLFIQSWSAPEFLLLIAMALRLVHSPKEKLEAMWAHRLLR